MKIEEMPDILDANDLSSFLGISKPACYAMMKREDFPTIKIGKRFLVAKDRFFEWLEKHTRECEK